MNCIEILRFQEINKNSVQLIPQTSRRFLEIIKGNYIFFQYNNWEIKKIFPYFPFFCRFVVSQNVNHT